MDMIPDPLLNRMKVFNLAGCITDEKMHIAIKFIGKALIKGMKKLTDKKATKLLKSQAQLKSHFILFNERSPIYATDRFGIVI